MRIGSSLMGGVGETAGAKVRAVFSRLLFPWHAIGALTVGVLLAKWTWILFAPHTLAVLPAQPETAGAASGSLFGVVAASGAAATTGGAALSNVHLVGVFTGKQGFAVLMLDEKKQLGVALGEEVAKGTKLVEVAADYVLLERNGVRERVNLENKFAGSKGLVVERPLPVSVQSAGPVRQELPQGQGVLSPALNAEQAVAEWNKARQEIQQGRGMANAR